MAQGYKLVTRKVTDLKGGEVQEKIYAIPDYNGYIDMDTLCIMISARSAFSSVDVNFYVPGADCLRQTCRLTVQTTQPPESRTDLSIPATTLKELSAGAAFIPKSGQATAEIRFLHDTLFLAATCDSLCTPR